MKAQDKKNLKTAADCEAIAEMENEGGGTRRPEVGCEKELNPRPTRHNSSPVIAVFRSKEAAQRALKALRQSGVANERIAVASGNASVRSPANDAGTYRATGRAADGQEFKDSPLPDSFRAAVAEKALPSPNRRGYEPDSEAHEYHNPSLAVMVSVAVGPDDRQKVRDLLVEAGAAREW